MFHKISYTGSTYFFPAFYEITRHTVNFPVTRPDYAPILRYIQNHYTTITLTELSKIFHYSIPYLSKIIKDTTDKNFVTLVRDLKMRDAVRYLEKTKLSMEEISIRIGYNSEDHFYRVFSAFYGISPLQYRKKKQT